jgi:DNA modification methylase
MQIINSRFEPRIPIAKLQQNPANEFPRPTRSALHPTTKPTGLIRHCLENSSLPGWIGYEPFAGSGSTLLAAQEGGRVAFCCELDPRYAAVVCKRASLLGLKPELEV